MRAYGCHNGEEEGMQGANTSIDSSEHAEILSRQFASQAFEQILSSGLPSLHRGAHRLLGNTADAEDAVQDALLAAYTHLDQFRGQSKLSTWLGAIVHNSARMQLRRRLRHVHVSLDEPIGEAEECLVWQRLAYRQASPEDDCRGSELGRRLSHFQTLLTPTLRKTFQLRDIDGLSIRETAQILGVPHGTVKAQSARARKKLKQLMQRALRPRTGSVTKPHEQHVLGQFAPPGPRRLLAGPADVGAKESYDHDRCRTSAARPPLSLITGRRGGNGAEPAGLRRSIVPITGASSMPSEYAMETNLCSEHKRSTRRC